MTFRRAINRLHLWLGLVTALPVVLLCLTGTLLVFEAELVRWEYRRFAAATPAGERQPLQTSLDAARRACPDLVFTTVYLPQAPRDAVRLVAESSRRTPASANAPDADESPPEVVSVDPYSAQVIDRRPYGSGFMPVVRRLHLTFLAGSVGRWIVGLSTMVFLGVLGSGLVLWFKRAAAARRLGVRLDARGKRLHYELHAAAGFYFGGVLFLIALSGVLIWIGAPWREGLLKATRSQWRIPPTLPPEAQPAPGATFISLDRALAIADAASPETRATVLQLPRKPSNPIAVYRRFWWGSRPTLTVSVHPLTGAVFDLDDPRRYDAGHLIHRLNRGLHSGEIGTEALRWLWFVASLMPVLLIWTGLKLWWKPRRPAVAVLRVAPPAGAPPDASPSS